MTRKWNIINDQSNKNYAVGNEIIYSKEVLKYCLCDYNDAYILVRGNITLAATGDDWVAFKNCSQFIKCITKMMKQQQMMLKI